jgi:dUTP pyrophosphatase
MKVKIKRLSKNSVIPKYSKQGDAGMDLTVTEVEYLDSEHIKLHFGLAFEIPIGYVGYIFPRSSCYKQRQIMSNSVGVVDSGYRGEVSAVMIGTCKDFMYKVGDRAAQIIIMPIPHIEFEQVETMSESERGDSGYGSSGN